MRGVLLVQHLSPIFQTQASPSVPELSGGVPLQSRLRVPRIPPSSLTACPCVLGSGGDPGLRPVPHAPLPRDPARLGRSADPSICCSVLQIIFVNFNGKVPHLLFIEVRMVQPCRVLG